MAEDDQGIKAQARPAQTFTKTQELDFFFLFGGPKGRCSPPA